MQDISGNYVVKRLFALMALLHIRNVSYNIMSYFEYTSTVWSPHLQYQIIQLEKVQCSAACFVTNDFSIYSDAVNVLQNIT